MCQKFNTIPQDALKFQNCPRDMCICTWSCPLVSCICMFYVQAIYLMNIPPRSELCYDIRTQCFIFYSFSLYFFHIAFFIEKRSFNYQMPYILVCLLKLGEKLKTPSANNVLDSIRSRSRVDLLRELIFYVEKLEG